MLECIDLHLGATGTLNEWQFLFQQHYHLLRPFLSPTGRRAALTCCPAHGPKELIVVGSDGSSTVSACTPPASPEASSASSDVLELWEFCPCLLATYLGGALGLHPKERPLLQHGQILHIGALHYGTNRYPAYLLKNGPDSYLESARSMAAAQQGACIFFTPRYCAATDKWSSRRNLGYFTLEQQLFPDSFIPVSSYRVRLQECLEAFTRSPAKFAAGLNPEPNLNGIVSRIDTIEKTVLPDASRGSKTRKSASAGGKARAKSFQAKYEEARRFMLDYHRRNPSVSFTQVRCKAARHLTLSESALKNRFKKGDFPDW